ncbi:hypothetical protein KY290_002676 [Solanum tuberosum]|uniref:Calmodulin binding protein n=1 Tax=Solanum tuberosum TaxID=4113 RepID=A0ABQ7WQR2_SOLTU|nr:hypothetical protein KY290_002676 [Solanum tuberosum]
MKPLENHSSIITTSSAVPESEPEAGSAAEAGMFSDDIDSSCSTPYVSAPSSPGRGQPHCGFYYSAPASPMHFVLSTTSVKNAVSTSISSPSEDFDFSARLTTEGGGGADGSMSSADELFLNGQIRPMKLSTHLKRPQVLAPLLDLDENEDEEEKSCRGRDLKLRSRSLRRRTRSMSPLRTTSYEWQEDYEEEELEVVINEKKKEKNENEEIKQDDEEETSNETTPCPSGSSSRSSSVGRSSKRWVFLKEFLYRSKSEGRNNGHKFWSGISFSPVKDKKLDKIATNKTPTDSANTSETKKDKQNGNTKEKKKKPVNGSGIGKRRVPPSPHELHYTTNRAQSEEMRKKTFLPYRQGLLGCLGFSSKSYGAMNGFARALNPVSSRPALF